MNIIVMILLLLSNFVWFRYRNIIYKYRIKDRAYCLITFILPATFIIYCGIKLLKHLVSYPW